jgi:ubiquitin-conjugating enzyme (huntingtin interacting protein 2)
MASNKARRITKELADLHADSQSQVHAETVGDDVTRLKGSFGGPSGTPYEGGKYEINIEIPNEYPFRPPVMKFATKVWHPNISSQTVSICSPSEDWSCIFLY